MGAAEIRTAAPPVHLFPSRGKSSDRIWKACISLQRSISERQPIVVVCGERKSLLFDASR